MPHSRDISEDMQAVLDAAVDAVILIDHQGRMLVANRTAERLFGYPAAQLVGQNVSMLMPEAQRREHDGYIARYIATGEARVIGRGREVVAVRRDGSAFPAHLSVGVVRDADPPRFAGFVRDLTDERARDAEMRRSQERLAQVARFASMGELAAGIAHELNQPLAAIATYAQACDRLLATPNPAVTPVQDALKQIADQALRAGEVIRRLRHLVSDRKTEQRREDLNDVARETAELAARDIRQYDVRLELALEAERLPAIVDRVQIQQVLLNLLRNAMEALGDVPAARRRIVLGTVRLDAHEAEIVVRDQGPGVPAEAAVHLFEPFFTTKTEGTGLGLAISRTIARAHRGTLAFRPASPQGAGAEFFLRLPLVESSP